MFDLDRALIDPAHVPAEALHRPDVLDLRFEGFSEEAFAILERLRAHPHIERYRQEKAAIRAHLIEPFRRYRDDLVVAFVLPNRLAFETERGVFSRLLKNDFGAGGCHHHLWLSFYRPGFRRLTDVQLAHTIRPDGFTVGLFVGERMGRILSSARRRMLGDPGAFLRLLNPLLHYEKITENGRRRVVCTEPLEEIPEALVKAKSLWVRQTFARADVLRWRGDLVKHSLDAVRALWPLYRYFAGGRTEPKPE
jgi:hypothetical protein